MRSLLLLICLGCACSSGPSETLRLGLGGDCNLAGSAGCASGFCADLDTGAAVCTISCGSGSSCPGGWTCRDDRNPSVCVPAANVRLCSADSNCPAAHRCTSSGACVIPAARSNCVRCSDSMQCADGLLCASAGDGLGDACLSPCQADACEGGATCVDGACVPIGSCGLAADLCASCFRDAECGGLDDYCVRNLQLGVSFCARDCSQTDCPSGFRCQDFEFGKQCVPDDGQCSDRCLGDADCPQGFACSDGRCGVLFDHRGLCAPCGDDGDCENGICVQGTDGRGVCAPRCGDDQVCPNGAACGAVSGSAEALCLPRTGRCPVGVGAVGRRCNAARDCASGLCLRSENGGSGRCVEACAAGQCPGEQACTDVAGVPVCLDGQGADGAPCTTGATCAGGLCVTLASESICSRPCGNDNPCSGDWQCAEVSADRTACLPQTEGGGVGAMCHAGASACSTGLCLIQRAGPVCTARCAAASECPSGWGCMPVEGRGMPDGGATVCVLLEER